MAQPFKLFINLKKSDCILWSGIRSDLHNERAELKTARRVLLF